MYACRTCVYLAKILTYVYLHILMETLCFPQEGMLTVIWSCTEAQDNLCHQMLTFVITCNNFAEDDQRFCLHSHGDASVML